MSSAQPPLATATAEGMAGLPDPSGTAASPDANGGGGDRNAAAVKTKGDYRGFVGGVFSGIAKLSGRSCLVLPVGSY